MDDKKAKYAWAIGGVILAFTEMEAEILSLIEALASKSRPELEPENLSNKLVELEKLAQQYPDEAIKNKLVKIASAARRLNVDRVNFVHGELWVEPSDKSHHRHFVPRRTGTPEDDERTPDQIKAIEDEIVKLCSEVAALAATIRRAHG